ncbi:MFS multidrug transporter, putative [Aspergillus fumigatus A1163]|uniref:MFS multidrug transporter, putative n=1 Tax=Aspergillus fumigatus (strain CBS 144.89 / FGSC A1163 / CEA10) TaxID=451804 RepID=B0XZP1_ASPFC|nr:MFS multidrug transporter, putative [Aspergillus fumigatus A1163]
MLAMAASAEETNRQSNAGRRSVISPSEAPPEAEQSDVYQTPPPGLKEWLFILILCSTQLFVQGAFGYILIPLHIVGQTFGQGPSEATRMTWHVGGYSLTVGTFILIAGKLGDLYGSKRILVLGWAWFGVWSVIGGCSAFTHSPVFFDTARALQGIGPALLLPNALAIAGRTYPPGKKKNMIFSAFAVAAPLGCFTAGVVGSVFAQYVWWPWVMWTYSIGCFIIAAVGLWVIPSDYPRCQKAATLQFDYIGSVLGVAGLLLLNISWNQAPIDGWSTPYVYVLLIGGFLVLGLFVLQERRAPGIRSWINFAMCLLWIQQCSSRQGPSQGILPALATPYLMAVITSGWLMAIACAAFLGGCILQSTAPVEQSYWMNTFWSFVIMAWGMDISFPASTTILSDAVPVKHQGASASLVNTVINYSIAIGLGIAGTVEAEVSHQGVNQLRGYRAALWSSVGLAALAFGIALVYAVCTFQEQRSSRKSSQEREQRACIEGCILGLTLTPDREWERVELGRLLSHVSQTGGLRSQSV